MALPRSSRSPVRHANRPLGLPGPLLPLIASHASSQSADFADLQIIFESGCSPLKTLANRQQTRIATVEVENFAIAHANSIRRWTGYYDLTAGFPGLVHPHNFRHRRKHGLASYGDDGVTS